MHPLVVERDRLERRIAENKKAIRRIRIELGMDAAALATVADQCRHLGIPAIPVTRTGVEDTHGRPTEDRSPED